MGGAYTPGLKVTENEALRKERILPLKGDVIVAVGATVNPDDVVARTFLPGRVEILNAANKLGIDQQDVPLKMLKSEGEAVEEGEVIARSKGLFGLFKSEAKAPLTGTIESVSGITGQVIIRGEPQPVQVKAYVKGEVSEVIPDEGVIVDTCGTFIQGIFGVGGETFGEIVMGCESPAQELTPDLIKPSHEGKIVIGGSLVTKEALEKAISLGVRGVVAGGFDAGDLIEFLGYDLGVAITGHENLGITLIVTEGFGHVNMTPRAFALFKAHQGQDASINGATQIRAGVIRPEVIIPIEGSQHIEDKAKKHTGELLPGTPLRIIRAPYFGVLATVKSLPTEPHVLESGSKARVVEVELEGGEAVLLPRANVEIIEE